MLTWCCWGLVTRCGSHGSHVAGQSVWGGSGACQPVVPVHTTLDATTSPTVPTRYRTPTCDALARPDMHCNLTLHTIARPHWTLPLSCPRRGPEWTILEHGGGARLLPTWLSTVAVVSHCACCGQWCTPFWHQEWTERAASMTEWIGQQQPRQSTVNCERKLRTVSGTWESL